MLSLVLVVIATTTPIEARLAKALNFDLPPWGASVSAIEEQYLLSLPIHEPECGTQSPGPDAHEWRHPGLSIAGAEVSKIVFAPGSDGLEAVTFQFQRGAGRGVDARKLLDHFIRIFGKPVRTGRLYSLWEIGDSVLAVSELAVSVVRRDAVSEEFLRNSATDYGGG